MPSVLRHNSNVVLQFMPEEVPLLINYLKPFRNTRDIGSWLGLMESMVAPVIEGNIEDVRSFSEPVDEEEVVETEMGADGDISSRVYEAISTSGVWVAPPDAAVGTHLGDCVHCEKPFWRHSSGSNRCMMNGALLTTSWEPKGQLMLPEPKEVALEEDDPNDGAKFAVTVMEAEKCPTCGSNDRTRRWWVKGAGEACKDTFHDVEVRDG